MKGLAPLACLYVLSTPVLADQQEPVVYVGAAYSHVFYEAGDYDGDLAAYGALLGFPVDEHFAVELRYLVGEEGEATEGGNSVDVNHMLGAYLRGGLAISDRLYPYALLGRNKVEMNGGAPGDGGKSGLSYGLGLQLSFTESPALLNIEYVSLLDTDDYELNGLTVSLQVQY